MTGDQHEIITILVKHALQQPLNAEEEELLKQWRQRSEDHATLADQVRDREWLDMQRNMLHAPPTEEMWEAIRRHIEGGVESPVITMAERRKIGWRWSAVAALLLAALVYGGMRLRSGERLPVKDSRVAMQRLDIPAEAEATKMQWPDGSSAWIKPGSSIEYAIDLRAAPLKVEGEVWFRIAPDAGRPIIIAIADGARVEVLGTSFAIRSITGREGNRVALFSGAVRVVKGADSVLLMPGMQAQTGGLRIKTADVDSNAALAWLRPAVKTKDFVFRDADLLQLMPEIAAWYRVEVVNPLHLRGVRVRGDFLRTTSLPALIASLNEIEGSHVRIQLGEDTIFISPLKPGQ